VPKPKDTLWPSQPRTLIKHHAYQHYVQCWMGKVLQTFPRAAVVDAFAGPGGYSDGLDGSPVVVAKTFLSHSSLGQFKGELHLLCAEQRADRRDELDNRLAALPAHPLLRPKVLPAGAFADRLDELDRLAHSSYSDVPTLWLLDPFDIKSLPFSLVERCLRRRRDEVLITWFADELNRFCELPNMPGVLSEHFGGTSWQEPARVRGEGPRKRALLAAYKARLGELPDVHTGDFSVSSRNETARYTLVFATHSMKGLQCWNPVKWRLDPGGGDHASEQRSIHQGDLFADQPATARLRTALAAKAGTTASFAALMREATKLGFMETHLRIVLDELRDDGLAARELPLESRTPWPTDSVVRFYSGD
jgi:three-Cys-motif partner protein